MNGTFADNQLCGIHVDLFRGYNAVIPTFVVNESKLNAEGHPLAVEQACETLRDRPAVKLSTDAAATAVNGHYTRVYVLVPAHLLTKLVPSHLLTILDKHGVHWCTVSQFY